MSLYEVKLLLGSNKNFPEKNIELAIKRLEKDVGKIQKKSKILKTLAEEFVSCNIFCNIALSICTPLSPIQLLKAIKKIETELGRTLDSRDLGAYYDREIDIDIVEFERLKFVCEELNIPHYKHKYTREFSKTLLDEI